ncbi:LOW QUALITY PROTEIN: DNA replication factor Cdt1-like [Ctenocephalides felis]|uniref:LOW QUALITY PROTEIN: DNA replication factor Cdt1-like n=1 Tax=Ctenocephalides felis TaxID=7515 RepID=UPI000E6E1333|nr:LOW QUALITY PROTEIN: DNA replication factor Cdt1-like [Ctenocephalides felis]
MAQPSITSYFNTRKRAAIDDISSARNKVMLLDNDASQGDIGLIAKAILLKGVDTQFNEKIKQKTIEPKRNRVVTKLDFDSPVRKTPVRRVANKSKNATTPKPQPKQNCIFTQLGSLSPVKKAQPPKEIILKKATPEVTNASCCQKEESIKQDNAVPAETNQNKKDETKGTLSALNAKTDIKDMSYAEIKTKLTKSSRLEELKARVNKLNEGMKKLDEKKLPKLEKPSLKEFKTIDLVVTTSPQKVLTPPRKTLYSPHKVLPKYNNGGCEQLMSPRKTEVARKLNLSSPVKAAIANPAYQRYQGLAESTTPSLSLPHNYRCLAELFRCVDAVCAMLYNRKETITFKKLKPAVQEMTRKNFTESHLAQIKFIYPEAYTFSQEKMHNFGSTSKQDKYELVIIPNVGDTKSVEINADDVLKSRQVMNMNPQVMLERQRTLYNLLLNKVLDEHEKYLLSLDPPMSIPKNKLTRWHAGFDIENMPDIEKSALPQPPNVEKFTSASDVLLKARNLFNCNTRMEKALERLAEAKSRNIPLSAMSLNDEKTTIKTEPVEVKVEPVTEPEQPLNPALKGLPKSLLEKIRAKQAAKALEAMTRSPAQNEKALKYQRLPEIARHTRNLFVTEKKSVLPLEIVLNKLGNSYRTSLTPTELEQHLRLLSESLPGWLVFHDIRQTIFIKLSKNTDMAKVQERLEALAAKHSK